MGREKTKARKKSCDRREEEEEIHGTNIAFRTAEHSACIITRAIPLPRIVPGLSAPLSGIDGDGAWPCGGV
jgi:hypothetical protein